MPIIENTYENRKEKGKIYGEKGKSKQKSITEKSKSVE
jgi:hypothetical protein